MHGPGPARTPHRLASRPPAEGSTLLVVRSLPLATALKARTAEIARSGFPRNGG